ncbi:as-48h [Agrilactobacillus composti DSM 18527 = JCM 14202]|uniref:As-48h n=1 Tax=Agrilactobacillus composti DSM 18527 = JCM 14202 TaxID=1423734 RepID=X0PR20_9LACO|nr:ABC transporter permease [Agrilactobacillus composti]KRM35132.1 as-48h [Agrilactobacillus composti DSM 18527 = JCM 14202]GAF40242.1 cell division protein FtsX [Agrilactobacillus composti DSM 18527 = JCM 14202]
MRIQEIWQTSIRSIFKNKRRSILTMLGIVIGIAAVVTILAIGHGFSKWTTSQLTNNASGDTQGSISFSASNGQDDSDVISNIGFNDSDVLLAEGVTGVKKAKIESNADQTIFSQTYNFNGKMQNEYIGLVAKDGSEVKYGRALRPSDNQMGLTVAVIDNDVATNVFGTAKAALGRGIDVGGELYEVVGVRAPSNFSFTISVSDSDAYNYANIQVPKKAYQAYNRSATTSSNLMNVTVAKGEKTSKVLNNVVKALKASGTQRNSGKYTANDPSEATDAIGNVLGNITTFVACVAGISLFIAGVGVMNMMYISVAERTSEIGIRRAMGATQGNIRLQFLLESATLTIIGGLIGYILGVIAAALVGLALPFPISIDLSSFILAFGVSTLVGVVFGVMPASSAAKKDLIDIIR